MTAVRVLIIDDVAEVRRTLCRALERDGYDVRVAATGYEANEMLQSDMADVVLMDLRMPVMSGQTLYQLIRSQWPDLARRVAVMSGDPDAVEYADWLALHDLPVLAKPFRLADVRQLIQTLAARSGPHASEHQA